MSRPPHDPLAIAASTVLMFNEYLPKSLRGEFADAVLNLMAVNEAHTQNAVGLQQRSSAVISRILRALDDDRQTAEKEKANAERAQQTAAGPA